ncbi:TonB-linked SusC/RagA family outer membrane protein [Chitinophaga dinghuensis]|uniref:TonB-linked SusC/RagA family outer membrane protein n=1 Tax=Chitinophaga dinghuensis TaxID=1539050 RepID=A0A327W0C5_9BACT|nr:SusC/RagA family TonB-linked outer membrane protein [Chitinophaga dinghuensis]RAJ81840.1 TonB-linked SusC/RagA family outer membrane protein [Chitinophaga dinghuensis]
MSLFPTRKAIRSFGKKSIVSNFKMSCLLIPLLAMQLLSSAKTQQQRLSVHLDNVAVTTLFSAIEKQSSYRFVYSSNIIPSGMLTSVNITGGSLQEILQVAFEHTGLDFKLSDNNLVIISQNTPAFTIRGKVKDNNGSPVPGVNVMILGTSKGCITNESGEFTLESDKQLVTLVFSSIGFESKKVVVNGKDALTVVLEPNVQALQQVVVTGYQTISRERSAGSFTKVDGAMLQSKSGSMNVVDRLEGLVPGFAVNNSAKADKFLIRGATSVNGNRAPLFVVDGVPMELENLTSLVNPNDVESITFLKDATAASIWGARAANGVVVVTTKKGKFTNRSMKVSYDGFLSFKGLPDYNYLHMMNSRQFVDAAKETFNPTVHTWNKVTTPAAGNLEPVVYPHETILYNLNRGIIDQAMANKSLDSLASLNNRGQIEKELLQPGMLSNHSLSFTGGGNFHSYYGSFAYTNQQNNDKSSLQRFGINLRQDFQINKSIKADITTNVSQESSRQFVISNLPDLNTYLPYMMFRDQNGNTLSHSSIKFYQPFRENAEKQSKLNLDYNPLDDAAHNSNNKVTVSSVRLNGGLNIKLVKGLTYEGRGQYQLINSKGFSYNDQQSYAVRSELAHYTVAATTPQGMPVYYLPSSGGFYKTVNNQNTSWTVRNQLMYDNHWRNEKHQLNMLVGSEVRANKQMNENSFKRGFDFQTNTYQLYDEYSLTLNGVKKPVIGTSTPTSSTFNSSTYKYAELEDRYFSLYGNGAYTFNRKYNLNSSVRMDQSNLFGTERSQQYKPIWSVGAGWLLSNEPFFQVSQISRLNVRLTYGLGGNAPKPGDGSTRDIIMATSSSLFNGMGAQYTPLSPGNKMLTWEATHTLNAGIDFEILNQRINGSLDIYNKTTTNLLGQQNVDATTGWYAVYGNLGKMTNKGFDLQVNSKNISGDKFSWNTLLTLGLNINKVVQLSRFQALTIDDKPNSWFVEGYPAYSIFGFNYVGLNNQGNPQILTAGGKTVVKMSDAKPEDISFAGSTQPKWYGGMTNTFRYGQFDLSCLVVYNFGFYMRKDVNRFYSGRLSANLQESFANRWKQPGDEAFTDIPGYIPLITNVNDRNTNFYRYALNNIERADYVKLRDFTIGYHLPAAVAGKAGMESCRFYVQLNNVMLWKMNKDDIDPEYYNLVQGTRTLAMKPFYTIGLNVRLK